MNTISRTLALLKPADLFPAWKWIDMMEERDEINADEGRRWKEGIYELMVLWGLEPDELGVLLPVDKMRGTGERTGPVSREKELPLDCFS